MLIFISERNEKRDGDHGADHRVELVGIAYQSNLDVLESRPS